MTRICDAQPSTVTTRDGLMNASMYEGQTGELHAISPAIDRSVADGRRRLARAELSSISSRLESAAPPRGDTIHEIRKLRKP